MSEEVKIAQNSVHVVCTRPQARLTVFKAMNDVPKGQPSLFLCHWIVCWHDENFTFLEELKDCKSRVCQYAKSHKRTNTD